MPNLEQEVRDMLEADCLLDEAEFPDVLVSACIEIVRKKLDDIIAAAGLPPCDRCSHDRCFVLRPILEHIRAMKE